jgi:hypothetical protein
LPTTGHWAGQAFVEGEIPFSGGSSNGYNATGEHTAEVYDQTAYCSNQMLERIVGDVRQKAATNDQAFGGGYAEIVNRMLAAMQEKRDLLLDNFKHRMMGDHRLKKDPVVNVINTQTSNPGAIQQAELRTT